MQQLDGSVWRTVLIVVVVVAMAILVGSMIETFITSTEYMPVPASVPASIDVPPAPPVADTPPPSTVHVRPPPPIIIASPATAAAEPDPVPAEPSAPVAAPVASMPKAPASRPPPPGARVARSLKDFVGVDDSLVFPRRTAPEIKNITQQPDGSFKFVLRHRGNPWSPINPKGVRGAWYDGDRDLKWNEGRHPGAIGKYHDKSRAEVAGLAGVNHKYGETWEYGTTFLLDPNFVPSKGYCNLMQPTTHVTWLEVNKIKGDEVSGALKYSLAKTGFHPAAVARPFTVRRNEWVTVVVRTKIHETDGILELSINGDKFQGVRGVRVNNESAKGRFTCKWGIYGSATWAVTGKALPDWVVFHRDIWARKVA
jgi:hypothetical protein